MGADSLGAGPWQQEVLCEESWVCWLENHWSKLGGKSFPERPVETWPFQWGEVEQRSWKD